MPAPPTIPFFNSLLPAAASGYQNVIPQQTNGAPINDASFEVPGTGGVVVKTGSYSATASDCGEMLSFEGSSALTYTLANPPFFARWCVFVLNNTTASLTISPNTLQINSSTSSVSLPAGSGAYIATDGTNYKATFFQSAAGLGNTRPSLIAFDLPGLPPAGNLTGSTPGCRIRIPISGNLNSFVLPANMAGSGGTLDTNPTASAVYTVYKNILAVGTVTISTSGTFTWATTGGAAIVYTPGTDVFAVIPPTTQDTTLSGVSLAFAVTVS